MKQLSRPLKITLAVLFILPGLLVLDCGGYYLRTKYEEKTVYPAQRTYYEAFLKLGMPRIEVERELRQRSIHFRQNYEYGAYPKDEFVLLKRIGSPVFYCSFEDITLHLEFNATDNMADPLTGISEYRALIDCL